MGSNQHQICTSHKQVYLNIKCKYWYVATFLPTVPETKCLSAQTNTFDNFSLVMSSLDIAFNQANCRSVVSDSICSSQPVTDDLWKPKKPEIISIRPVGASYHCTKHYRIVQNVRGTKHSRFSRFFLEPRMIFREFQNI